MNDVINLSTEEMIIQGYVIVERRFNSISFVPTERYKIAMRNPYPNGVPVLYETSKGRFLKSGNEVKLLGSGDAPELNVIHDAILEENPEKNSELYEPLELPEKF